MIKLVASDLDGTLLDPAGNLPDGVFDVIEDLHARGVLFCAASGRQLTALTSMFAPVADKILFMAENIWQARTALGNRQEKSPPPKGGELGKHLFLFLAGAAGLVAGARLLVDSATSLAALLGVSQGVVGATIVALGTSLPELVTTLTAVARKQASLSAGNILGANIIDNALILPACGLVSGGALPISLQTRMIDLPFCLVDNYVSLARFPGIQQLDFSILGQSF